MRTLARTLLVALVVGALAACQGARYAPSAPVAGPPAALHRSAAALASRSLLDCSASTAPIPGNYILLYSDGNVKGGAYSAIGGFWIEGRVEVGPSPQPSTGPPTPTQQTYLYSGTYHLRNARQTGCIYLETTLSGKPFRESSNNASLAGLPKFGTTNFAFDGTKSGRWRLGALHLTATGGRAIFSLMLQRHLYDGGTLTLTKRSIRRGP